ncbi:L-ribulose-5-phosphate 4-epimerase [Rhodothermus marinus]|uniref:L-ribulose-5-phosphate 4-epimerase n=1 Tax=Rhodothermus marinus TaxID=29549 RepID=UPI0006D2BFC4|nr:L-ribulose-5-phosphate 4-epimerase [Rhodothermus marinus]
MAFEKLKAAVWKANRDIVRIGLVQLTWGNASGVDRQAGVMAIKPSGVDYDRLRPDDMVIVELETGRVVEGTLKPSTDTPTHRYLYLAFEEIGGIVHTHSRHAVAWAQARRPIPCLGTTHADHFYGEIPVTRPLRPEEVAEAYEHQTGVVIVECFRERGLDPLEVPGVLVAGHGPFAWGETPEKAAENALVLELVAEMALYTCQLNPEAPELERYVLDKHFRRKHGSQAYYGQR